MVVEYISQYNIHSRDTFIIPKEWKGGLLIKVKIYPEDFTNESGEFILIMLEDNVMIVHQEKIQNMTKMNLKESRINDIFWIFKHYEISKEIPPIITI